MIPVMLTIFFGISEIANYILAARKVSNVASSAADLVAQDTLIDDAEMDDIMGALDVILRPFNSGKAKIRITSVVADVTPARRPSLGAMRATFRRAPKTRPSRYRTSCRRANPSSWPRSHFAIKRCSAVSHRRHHRERYVLLEAASFDDGTAPGLSATLTHSLPVALSVP